MVRSTRILAATLAMSFLPLVFCNSAAAQISKKNQEFIPGKVVSIEKDKTGRNYKMKFQRSDDEEELDVTIGPRTQLLVTVKGDESFLKPNVYVQTKVALTNNEFYANEFTVIVGATPPAFVKPDPMDKSVFDIGGKVTMMDASGMMVQCGAQPRKVMFESTKTVTVKIADAALIEAGDEAEIEGTIVKSKKTMNAMAVNVSSEKEINAEEYLASLEDRKKSKSAKSKTTKAKTEGGTDGFDEANPFKNVDKKKGTKSKEETPKFDDTNPFKDVDKKKPVKSKEVKPTAAKNDEAKKDGDKEAEKPGDANKDGDKSETEKSEKE